MPTEPLTQHVLINGHRLAVGELGAGAPVILIHGTPWTAHSWRDVARRLADAGHHVHLYDMLGFGQSERPADPDVDTSVTAQLPILLALMDHWGLRHAHIVGHDIGGAVAQRLAVQQPHKILSLTLIDCVSRDSWPSERTRTQMAQGLDGLLAQAPQAHRAQFHDWMLTAVEDRDGLRAGALDRYLAAICGPVGQASFIQHQMRHYDPRHTLEVHDRLARPQPFLVHLIWGASDQWQQPAWAERLHAHIPGSRLTLIPGGGHLVMEDQPLAVTNAILAGLHPAQSQSA